MLFFNLGFAIPCIIILCKSMHHHTLQVRASSYFASPCTIVLCKSVHHHTLQVRASSYFASPCIIILCKSVHHHTLQVRASPYFASPCIIIFCKSVHHHTFNWITQPDAANSQVYYLSFKYSSTCFGHPYALHQELQQLQYTVLLSAAIVEELELIGVCCGWRTPAVLLVVVGPADRPDHDQQHCYHQATTANQRLLLLLL